MAPGNVSPAELPHALLESVAWTFRGEPFSDQAAFEEAVREYQNPQRDGNAWQPAEVVLRYPRVRITPDVYWYLADEDPVLELTADDGIGFTAGELLFKVHNAWIADLQQMDHKYFEGFSLAERQEQGMPPLYNLHLGS